MKQAELQELLPHQPTWRWLESTAQLQKETYGYADIYDLTLQKAHPQIVTMYLDWNTTAAVQELAEVREEFSWKPWATDQPFFNRDRIRDEIIDTLHFLGNILTALGVTDDELEAAYQQKQDVNRRRAASGNYSAQKGGLAEGSDVGRS